MLAPDANKTERLLLECLPSYFANDHQGDIEEQFVEYWSRAQETTGPRGEYSSKVAWDEVDFIIGAPRSREDARVRERISRAGELTLAIGCDLVEPDGHQPPTHPTRLVSSTGRGTLILVDHLGNTIAGSSTPNPRVPSKYGDADPYVFLKLGLAKVVETLAHQGADWGEGYEQLTDFMRRPKIRLLKWGKLPTVGMATAHRDTYSEENKGQDRHAQAFTGASHFTLTEDSRRHLLADPRFAAIHNSDLEQGLFTNKEGLFAGRLDSLVGRRAYQIYLKKEISTDFPYLDEPNYVNVNNN